MSYLGANMKLIVECSQKLVRLGENLWGKEQELDKADPLDVPTMTTDFVKEHGLPCPNGYQFKDENGNEILTSKIFLEKKKKEYPKTYGYCCDTLECCSYNVGFDRCETSYDDTLHNALLALRKLIICRDAYWKIAGEELGLGKPWEPVYQDDKQDKHCIYVDIWGVTLHQDNIVQHVLSFPTPEMRDAFYENFKELIEQCKELL